MKRVLIRVDAVRVSGLDRAGAAALPGRLEAAVSRAIEGRPTSLPRRTADVASVRVRLDPGSAVGPDDLATAMVDAIGGAIRGQGANR